MDGNAYKKRLDDFRRAQDAAQSHLLRNYYAHAINLTEESLWVLSNLIECGNAKFVEDKRLIDNRLNQQDQELKEIEIQLKEAQRELETKTDDLSRSLAILKIMMLRASLNLDVSGINTELLSIESSIRLRAVPSLAEQLFTNIFAPDEQSFKFEAVVAGIGYAISLVPFLGNVYSGLLTIHGITTNRKKAQKTADKHLVYLEDYCHALKIWEAAAQSAIRALQLIDED